MKEFGKKLIYGVGFGAGMGIPFHFYKLREGRESVTDSRRCIDCGRLLHRERQRERENISKQTSASYNK